MTKIELVYDDAGLHIHADGVAASLAVWMLETAKVNIITGGGKKAFRASGLDFGPPLDPKKVGR